MDLDAVVIPKREVVGRRAATKVKFKQIKKITALYINFNVSTQKIDYAALLNDDDSDDEPAGDTKAFSSDDESFAKPKAEPNSSGGSNMFDSLKEEDSPVKKAVSKRKLAAKPAPAKRTKTAIVDSDSDSDFGEKAAPKGKKKKVASSDEDFEADSDF